MLTGNFLYISKSSVYLPVAHDPDKTAKVDFKYEWLVHESRH